MTVCSLNTPPAPEGSCRLCHPSPFPGKTESFNNRNVIFYIFNYTKQQLASLVFNSIKIRNYLTSNGTGSKHLTGLVGNPQSKNNKLKRKKGKCMQRQVFIVTFKWLFVFSFTHQQLHLLYHNLNLQQFEFNEHLNFVLLFLL